MDRTELTWRRIIDAPASGAYNMARDHALALHPTPGQATLRLYRWKDPTISFGRNEPTARLYERAVAREHGVDFVRRPTGGRAVLHHDELTYSVSLSARAFGGPRIVYERIGQALRLSLGQIGVGVDLAKSEGRVVPPSAGPCFDLPAPGELVVDGRKLVGSAQVKIGDALLQHGSILLSADQTLLRKVSSRSPGGSAGAVTLRELLGCAPSFEAVEQAFLTGFQRHFGGRWHEGTLSSGECAAAIHLEEKYRSEDWTWRR